jgi:hypothetical protein
MILAHQNFIVALEAQSKLWNIRASSWGREFYLYPGSPTPKHLTGANRRYIQTGTYCRNRLASKEAFRRTGVAARRAESISFIKVCTIFGRWLTTRQNWPTIGSQSIRLAMNLIVQTCRKQPSLTLAVSVSKGETPTR